MSDLKYGRGDTCNCGHLWEAHRHVDDLAGKAGTCRGVDCKCEGFHRGTFALRYPLCHCGGSAVIVVQDSHTCNRNGYCEQHVSSPGRRVLIDVMGIKTELVPGPHTIEELLRHGPANPLTEELMRQTWPEPPPRPDHRNYLSRQLRLQHWLVTTFGAHVAFDRLERAMRVVEEAVELAQAEGVDRETVARILTRVYDRPVGTPQSEAAGVGLTLLAWSTTAAESLEALMDAELRRLESLPTEHFLAKHEEKVRQGVGVPPEKSE